MLLGFLFNFWPWALVSFICFPSNGFFYVRKKQFSNFTKMLKYCIYENTHFETYFQVRPKGQVPWHSILTWKMLFGFLLNFLRRAQVSFAFAPSNSFFNVRKKQFSNFTTMPTAFKQNTHFETYFKVIDTKYSKHWPYTVAHTIECVCSKINNSWFNPWFSFYFSSLL